MLYTEEAVHAGLRVRDGRRVFYLPEGSRLTPAARDWLRQEGVTVVPHAETPPAAYRTPDGASFAEKPEKASDPCFWYFRIILRRVSGHAP